MTPFTRTSGIALGVLLLSVPLSAVAAPTFKQIVEGQILSLGDMLINLLYLIAFAFFLFGVARYFMSSGANAEENRQKGRQHMLWGIIGLFVLFSIWGIINMFLKLLESWA